MKRSFLIAATAALLPAFVSQAIDTRQVYLTIGYSDNVDLGFVPSSYRQLSGQGVVSVSIAQGSSRVALTAAGGPGRSQIDFFDAAGGEGVRLDIEVSDNLDEILAALRRELDEFDDLEFVKGKNTVRIKGTISNPADWRKYKKRLSLPEFRGKVDDLVEVGVDAATIGQLRRDLEAEGVSLAPAGARPAEGQVALDYKHGQVVLSGKMWSAGERETLLRVLKSQTWLQIDDGKASLDAMKVPASVNVTVDDSILELGVAFVVVSKSRAKNLESGYDLTLKGVWGGVTDFLIGGTHTRQHGRWNDFTINAGLSSTLSMLAENGVSREKQQGTIRFHANGDPGKALHIGGTLKVTPDAMGDGAAPTPQDYEYGFKLVNKASRRLGVDMAEADIDIEIKGQPFYPKTGARATAVQQETRTVSPTLRVPLGKTVAVAGYESLLEETVPPSGIPLLRHIPVLSWFTSDRRESETDLALLFLVSVRKVDVESEAPMVENTPMKDITLDANTPNEDRIKEEYDRTKKYHGCWEPLNWLRW